MSALVAGLFFVASGVAGQRPTEPGMMGQGMGGMMQMMQMMGEGMMGPGMMEMMGQGMGMMGTGGPGPAMILRMGEALDLTDEQRTRLQAIQSGLSDSMQPFMAAVMEAHQEASAALEGDSPDFGAYERALRRAASQMVEAHVAMARAAAEGRDVLTEEQRQQLRDSMQMMRGMMGQGQSGMMSPRMRR
jgi:Spy/CpxP family protein refolding chaperone